MSGKGMGGYEYDEFLEAMEDHPDDMPNALVCSQSYLRELEIQFGNDPKLSNAGTGFAGHVVGIPVWIDNRFDQPVFFSGLE